MRKERYFTCPDSIPSWMTRDTNDVKKLVSQLATFYVFRVHAEFENEPPRSSE